MAQDPDRLRELGRKLDETQKRHTGRVTRPPPGQMGIAGRFATELVAAIVIGGGMGWWIDWLFGHFGYHTRPVFLLVFFVLGAAAGILNVKRAADEINAQVAAERNKDKGVERSVNPMEQFTVKPAFGLDHPLFLIGGHPIYFTNQALLMILVAVLSALFLTVMVKPGRLVPTRGQSMAEVSYEFVANMIHSATGEDGLKFFPFVFSLFIFVLASNFFGMIPGSFTVTSQIAVTFALACLVIGMVIVVGFMKHGIGFLKLFVPQAPWYLLILLIPIEIISFLTRPISLSVRLFANMLAGHTMLAVFAGFVVSLGAAGGLLTGLAIAPMLLIVAIMLLELLVAFLQAYVFAILTCIYLNEALHLHDHH